MNLPVSSSFRGMLLKGSPLFCGTMGVSLGGWYTNENLNSAHNYLSPQGYKYKVAEPNLSSQTVKKENESEIVDLFKFKNGNCAKTFFPGLEEIDWKTATETYHEDGYSVEMSTEQNGKAMGCILMESTKTSEKNLHVIKSELTFKRGNRGFILWTGFLDKENHQSGSKNKSHYLIYLENKGNKWNIVVGYFISADSEADKPEDTIKNPGSSVNWFADANKTLSYAGIWEESSSGGKGIFEDIYGKPSNEFTNSDNVYYFYIVDSKAWRTASVSGGDVDSAQYFSKIFNISKDKKGNWTDINSFCWNLSLRNLDLKDLCYEKNSN